MEFRTIGLELANIGIYTSPILFNGPIQLYRVFGTLSYAPPWELRLQNWRQALVWLRIPGMVGDKAITMGPIDPPAKAYGGGLGEGIWSANVKVFDQPGYRDIFADFNPTGLLIPDGQIDLRWDIKTYSTGGKEVTGQPLDVEVQLTFWYQRLAVLQNAKSDQG